jgi:two-component system sensor histidine kinase UhpB
MACRRRASCPARVTSISAQKVNRRGSVHSEGVVGLRIRDDGRGLGLAHEGAGIRGMRERALLVDATLDLGAAPTGGAEVNLLVPLNRKGA